MKLPFRRKTTAVLIMLFLSPLWAERQPYDEGAVGLALALRKLPVTTSFLHITAHPDDEVFGMAGTIIKRASFGNEVKILWMSAGTNCRGDDQQPPIDALQKVLGLGHVPHYTTLQKAARRLLLSGPGLSIASLARCSNAHGTTLVNETSNDFCLPEQRPSSQAT